MSAVLEPRAYRWTREEYRRLGDAGLLAGKRVELLEGEIIEMSPIDSAHSTAVGLAEDLLDEAFAVGYHVRVQQPLDLGDPTEPEPDVAVVAGSIRDYEEAHPRTAELVVEVASSSLRYDRERKAASYARAGIPEYWIVNLAERQVEVHRDPRPAAGRYAQLSIATEGESVSPLGAAGGGLQVEDLQPRRKQA